MLFYLKNWRLLETDGKSCQPLPAVLLNHLCPVQAEQSNCFHSTYTGLSSCWQPPRSPTCFRSVCSKDRRVQTFQVLLFLPSMEFRVSEKVTLETEAFELDVALLTVTFSRFPNQGSEEGFGSSAYQHQIPLKNILNSNLKMNVQGHWAADVKVLEITNLGFSCHLHLTQISRGALGKIATVPPFLCESGNKVDVVTKYFSYNFWFKFCVSISTVSERINCFVRKH